MITVTPARESRSRDEKRRRLVLSIGLSSWHITRAEAKQLRKDLKHALKETKHLPRRHSAFQPHRSHDPKRVTFE